MTCFVLKDGTTVHQWCVKNKIRYARVFRYLDEGMDPEMACKKTLEIKGKLNNQKFVYKGRSLRSLYKEDKSYQLVLRKIREGMTIEEAIQYEKRYRRFKNEKIRFMQKSACYFQK